MNGLFRLTVSIQKITFLSAIILGVVGGLYTGALGQESAFSAPPIDVLKETVRPLQSVSSNSMVHTGHDTINLDNGSHQF